MIINATASGDKAIIVIDDEPNTLQSIALHLCVSGYSNIQTFTSASDAAPFWNKDTCAAVILDVVMPETSGIDVLREIKSSAPDVPVIMVTGLNEVETAVACLKQGAHDYLVKPIEADRLIKSLETALRVRELEDDYNRLVNAMLSDKLEHPEAFAPVCTQSESMLRLFKYVESIAPTTHPVLITGETGTGKELFARAIHIVSGRKGQCVCVNVAGLDDTMFSDTLFGHVKGAFTGADTARPGLIESAAGGTIFLDEIGDLGIQSQVKLLRLIQEKEYRQLGSDSLRPCEARVIAATCRALNDLNSSSNFRKDLYYRLRTHHIHIPPLRERKEDLPLLVFRFVELAAQELDHTIPYIPPELYSALNAYHFPGNVRELQSMIFDAMSNTHNGKLLLRSIHQIIGGREQSRQPESGITFHAQLPTLKEIEHLLIAEAVSRSCGNQTVAADLLGITRQTLSYRLKQM